jgi:hypothetical protein
MEGVLQGTAINIQSNSGFDPGAALLADAGTL